MRGDQLYTVHETASTLTQQTIPAVPSSPGPAPLVANFSVDPPGLPTGAQMAAAEVLLAEASDGLDDGGPAQAYLYVSNRNVGSVLDPRGDAITIFRVEPALELLGYVFTGLDQVRGMELGGPQKEFLIAAPVGGTAGTKVYKRTDGGKNLTMLVQNTEIPTRSSFVWLN